MGPQFWVPKLVPKIGSRVSIFSRSLYPILAITWCRIFNPSTWGGSWWHYVFFASGDAMALPLLPVVVFAFLPLSLPLSRDCFWSWLTSFFLRWAWPRSFIALLCLPLPLWLHRRSKANIAEAQLVPRIRSPPGFLLRGPFFKTIFPKSGLLLKKIFGDVFAKKRMILCWYYNCKYQYQHQDHFNKATHGGILLLNSF